MGQFQSKVTPQTPTAPSVNSIGQPVPFGLTRSSSPSNQKPRFRTSSKRRESDKEKLEKVLKMLRSLQPVSGGGKDSSKRMAAPLAFLHREHRDSGSSSNSSSSSLGGDGEYKRPKTQREYNERLWKCIAITLSINGYAKRDFIAQSLVGTQRNFSGMFPDIGDRSEHKWTGKIERFQGDLVGRMHELFKSRFVNIFYDFDRNDARSQSMIYEKEKVIKALKKVDTMDFNALELEHYCLENALQMTCTVVFEQCALFETPHGPALQAAIDFTKSRSVIRARRNFYYNNATLAAQSVQFAYTLICGVLDTHAVSSCCKTAVLLSALIHKTMHFSGSELKYGLDAVIHTQSGTDDRQASLSLWYFFLKSKIQIDKPLRKAIVQCLLAASGVSRDIDGFIEEIESIDTAKPDESARILRTAMLYLSLNCHYFMEMSEFRRWTVAKIQESILSAECEMPEDGKYIEDYGDSGASASRISAMNMKTLMSTTDSESNSGSGGGDVSMDRRGSVALWSPMKSMITPPPALHQMESEFLWATAIESVKERGEAFMATEIKNARNVQRVWRALAPNVDDQRHYLLSARLDTNLEHFFTEDMLLEAVLEQFHHEFVQEAEEEAHPMIAALSES